MCATAQRTRGGDRVAAGLTDPIFVARRVCKTARPFWLPPRSPFRLTRGRRGLAKPQPPFHPLTPTTRLPSAHPALLVACSPRRLQWRIQGTPTATSIQRPYTCPPAPVLAYAGLCVLRALGSPAGFLLAALEHVRKPQQEPRASSRPRGRCPSALALTRSSRVEPGFRVAMYGARKPQEPRGNLLSDTCLRRAAASVLQTDPRTAMGERPRASVRMHAWAAARNIGTPLDAASL